jgi:AraC-like DNA-binding protein
MVMAFNPEDPHDGRAGDGMGFTYRMVHIGPALIASVLADIAPGRAGLPLFTEPVISDPVPAARLRDLHRALLGGASRLRRDEALTAAVGRMVMRAGSPASAGGHRGQGAVRCPRGRPARPRDPPGGYRADLTAADLSHATGRSRFAVHRAFTSVYGLAPSDYQRQLRLRAARQLIAAGRPSPRPRPRPGSPTRATSPGGSPQQRGLAPVIAEAVVHLVVLDGWVLTCLGCRQRPADLRENALTGCSGLELIALRGSSSSCPDPNPGR